MSVQLCVTGRTQSHPSRLSGNLDFVGARLGFYGSITTFYYVPTIKSLLPYYSGCGQPFSLGSFLHVGTKSPNKNRDKMVTFELPALKHLGELSGVRPTIVIDTREQDPLVFSRLPAIRGTLQSGDYSIAGLTELFAIERKTVSDLVGCCMGENRDRFERELHRLRGFKFRRLLVIGTEAEIALGDYHSAIKPQIGLGDAVDL